MTKLTLILVVLSLSSLTIQACAPVQPVVATPTPQWMEPGAIDIKDYVHQVFIHGVPYEETLETYDETVVPTLLEMLKEPTEEPYWANIVVVLNIVGDESVVEPLIEFIEQGPEGQLSQAHYTAKTSAIMAMGYLINRTGSEKALNYLIESLPPAAWQERGTTGFAPFQASEEESHTDLSKFAILGLALSGNSTAAEALRSLQEPPKTDAERIFQAQVGDVVAEALKANEMIANEGLIQYYEETRPEQ